MCNKWLDIWMISSGEKYLKWWSYEGSPSEDLDLRGENTSFAEVWGIAPFWRKEQKQNPAKETEEEWSKVKEKTWAYDILVTEVRNFFFNCLFVLTQGVISCLQTLLRSGATSDLAICGLPLTCHELFRTVIETNSWLEWAGEKMEGRMSKYRCLPVSLAFKYSK